MSGGSTSPGSSIENATPTAVMDPVVQKGALSPRTSNTKAVARTPSATVKLEAAHVADDSLRTTQGETIILRNSLLENNIHDVNYIFYNYNSSFLTYLP